MRSTSLARAAAKRPGGGPRKAHIGSCSIRGIPVTTQFDRTREKTSRARQLRRAMTDAEKKLWWRLRNEQLGISFRRQHPIGRFVVDFLAPSIGLVIELDGGQHGGDVQIAKDMARTAFLAGKGLRVMRFWNMKS